ncbi:ribosomal L1 domain-containing protein 1 [Betta splendens]|uniref:Ribosomal L1 domain-containing protein 1 n=1 Tax=Betta splendens TaxID=158456 RepID=A0A6P7L9Z8_BETSP|nr:ribosomal L1 domain-containing protein 1 [Betta splendens]
MAGKTEVVIDKEQVKKAVKALQAFIKSKSSGEALFLDEPQPVSLLFTLWKIPKQSQTIRIPLPHGHRSDTDEVCLFTKDEPNMTPEQTQRFYKRLLQEKGVKNISEVIPFTTLKKEYKPYEAKRRLLGNFDMFLSDDRIRRLLPSHLGKHFYERKKEPLTVSLKSNHLARDIQRVIQGTSINVSNRGCCCMTRVGNSDMTPDELTENIEATVQTMLAKLRVKGQVIKLIHIKTDTSVALPIYTSDLSQLSPEPAQTPKKKKAAAKKQNKKNSPTDNAAAGKVVKENKQEDEEEEIPELVPIETPRKKAKLQRPIKKQLQKTPTAAAVKKGAKPQRKLAQRMDSKVKRKVPKVK